MRKIAKAQPVKAAPSIPQLNCSFEGLGDSAQITVGQKLNLIVTTGGGDKITLSYTGAVKEHTFEILGNTTIEGITAKQTVTSYQVGEHKLTDITINNGDSVLGKCVPLNLKVQTVIEAPDTKAFAPFAPETVAIPLWWWILFALLGVAAFGGIIYGMIWYKKKKEKDKIVREQKRELTPEEKFFQRLRKLESSQYHMKGEYKTFALELTQIVKEALASNFRFNAEDLTTEEVLSWLQKKDRFFYDSTGPGLEALFAQLDQIKFAKVETTSEVCQALLDGAQLIGKNIFKPGGSQ
jgi:hypothetical protein